MAFGTGHHETTRTCLRALEKEVSPGDRVLDLGTGSGILAIAAARMGAREVIAVDTDDQAIENASENASLNGVEGRIRFRQGTTDPTDGLFEVVAANVTSGVLGPLVPELKGCLVEGGRLILAGILTREADAFVELLHEAGLAIGERAREGEWTTLVCVSAESG
jgi:ribosomal protein L11 methyltransferase